MYLFLFLYKKEIPHHLKYLLIIMFIEAYLSALYSLAAQLIAA